MTQNNRPLPSIDQLYNDPEWAYRQNELNRLLNVDPKEAWIKEHPSAKGVNYLPIERVEYLLTAIFLKWRVEVRDTKVIANAVQVTVRLHYLDPITGEWDWTDGVGACPIQTRKGANPNDASQVLHDAVVKAAPAAKSYAVKDASECLGRVFGKDLNRKDYIEYKGLDGKLDLSTIPASPAHEAELYDLLKTAANLSHEERDQYQYEIAQGLSVEDYQMMRRLLSDKQLPMIERLRNGENLSQKEIGKAIKEITQ